MYIQSPILVIIVPADVLTPMLQGHKQEQCLSQVKQVFFEICFAINV